MPTIGEARAQFVRVLDRIEGENREPSPSEDRMLRLAFENILDCHYPLALTALRDLPLDVKRDWPRERGIFVVSVNDWRRKLARVHKLHP